MVSGSSSSRVGQWLIVSVLVAGLAESGLAQMQKQNTTWIYPTLGCRANRDGENCYPFCPMAPNAHCEKKSVCRPTYVKTSFGRQVEWVMAAANPTPPDNVYIIRMGGRPDDDGKSCCGFSPVLQEDIWTVQSKLVDPDGNSEGVLAPDVENWPPMSTDDVNDNARKASVMGSVISLNLAPEILNITHVKFTWNVTRQEASTFAVTPVYNVSYDARYGYSILDGEKRLHNTSACKKDVFFRICSDPFFTAEPKDNTQPLMGAPSPAGLEFLDVATCGLSVHTPCIRSPGYLEQVGAQLQQVFDVGMFNGNTNHGVRIGEEIKLELTLSTLDAGGKVQMITVDDPGLPIGAELTDDRACGQYTVCRTFTWTPRKGQEGKVHDAHLVGRSSSSLKPEVEPCDEIYTKETVFRVKVLGPESNWLSPSDPAGPPSNADYYKYQMAGEPAAWAGNAAVGTEFIVTLQCESNYVPKIDMEGDTARFEKVSTEESDPQNVKRMSTYNFGYTPKRGDEGSTKIWRFHCGDNQNVQESFLTERLIRTVVVKTKLCAYSVDAGETLSTMTRRYQLSTNWLNVWNANPMLLTDPDLDLTAGAEVRIGPVYAVKPGDTLNTVAAQFSTTIKKLLSVNPHLTSETAPDMQLLGAMRLCIIACTSHPSPTYSYKWAY